MSNYKKLTARQKKFADWYLENGEKIAEAVVFAGYVTKNPNQIGTRLLRHELIREYLNQRREEIRKMEDDLIYSRIMTRAQIQLERNRIASSDLSKILDKLGDLNSIDEDSRRAISSIKIRESFTDDGKPIVTTEITLWDKLKALKELDDHLRERESIQNKQDGLIIENALQLPDYDSDKG